MFQVHNKTPEYITEYFVLPNTVDMSITFKINLNWLFCPSKPRTEYFKHSLKYSECLVWNSLAEEMKKCAFHSRYLKWLDVAMVSRQSLIYTPVHTFEGPMEDELMHA